MGTDVFLLTKPAGSNSIQRACSQARSPVAVRRYMESGNQASYGNARFN